MKYFSPPVSNFHYPVSFKAVHQLSHPSDIYVYGTELNTPAATGTLNTLLVFIHIIFQFVHKPLANALDFFRPGIMA